MTNDIKDFIDFSKSKLLTVSIDSKINTQIVQCLELISKNIYQSVQICEDDNIFNTDNKSFLDIDPRV